MSANDLAEYISEGDGYLRDPVHGSDLLNRGSSSLQDSLNQGRRETDAFRGSSLSRERSESKRDTSSGRHLQLSHRNEERRLRRDNRGSYARDVQEIMGSRGIEGAREVRNIVGSTLLQAFGLQIPENLTIRSGVESIRQGLENARGISSGAGLLDNISNGLQMASDSGHGLNLRQVSESLSRGGRRELQDNDGDGDVDSQDIAISKQGDRLIAEMRLLHPLIAKAHRDPNFMRRKIEHRKISNESTHTQENQVNLVQQGIAGHIEDVNMFQVAF